MAAIAILASLSLGFAQGWAPDLAALDSKNAVEVEPAPPAFGASGVDQLKPKVSLRTDCPEPQAQGKIESCVGWALGYGLLSVLLKQKDHPFSPSYVYRWALDYHTQERALLVDKKIINNSTRVNWPNEGVDFPYGFIALTTQGSCRFGAPSLKATSERELEIDPLTVESVQDGNAHRTYFKAARIPEADIVNSMKKILSKGKPIPCGFRIYRGFQDGEGFASLPGVDKPCLWTRQPDPDSKGFHAMLVIGYDDAVDDGKGAFEVMNSYGKEFADHGYFWVSYDLVANLGKRADVRSDNPCLLVAWDYEWGPIVPSFDLRQEYVNGNLSGWVRLADIQGETNFKLQGSNEPVLTSLRKNDALTATQAVTVRRAFDASGKSATSSAPPIKKLSVGDKVVVEDLNILSTDGGKKSEYWIKVRNAAPLLN